MTDEHDVHAHAINGGQYTLHILRAEHIPEPGLERVTVTMHIPMHEEKRTFTYQRRTLRKPAEVLVANHETLRGNRLLCTARERVHRHLAQQRRVMVADHHEVSERLP